MTENELILKQRECGDTLFVATRSGRFYHAYDCGAFALARATGYHVMRRPRRGGTFVLTAGFPESRLENVLERIEAAGGRIERRDADCFVFSGIDGSADGTLVSEQKPAEPRGESGGAKGTGGGLREEILSFDLSRSTPMDAMNFIDTLQKRLHETDT